MRIDPRLSRREMMGASAALAAGSFLARIAYAQPADRWPNIAEMAQRYVREEKVANMIAYLGRGANAELVGAGRDAFGSARRSDEDSLYRIYSMTKPITGVAAMMLVEEGKLGLDQPLAEILPDFAEMQVQKRYDGPITPDNLEPAARPITIRQLLTHTAGLGYPLIQQGPIFERMSAAGIVPVQLTRLPIVELAMGSPVESLTLFASRLARLPLVYQPGTRWSYSASLDLMGRVIEVVSGQAFDEFLKQRIFDPLGMDSTWFRVPRSETGRLTTSYGVVGGFVVPIDMPGLSIFSREPPFPMGGSGLVSSPRDYDRFMRMLAGYGQLDERRVMSARTVRTATSNLLAGSDATRGTLVRGFGFGAGGRVGWPTAPDAFGWGGIAGTIGIVDMASGRRAGLYTQYVPVFAYPVYEDFEQALARDLELHAG